MLEEPARLADDGTKLELDGLKMGAIRLRLEVSMAPINQLRCASAF
jgi:hypothetical protein